MERGVDASRPAARLAAAPISWGVCEVPGWGLQLPPDRVLAEMADAGDHGHRAGSAGLAAARRRAGPRPSSTATGCGSSAASCRSSSTSPTSATRARTRPRGRGQLAAAGARRLRRGARRRPRLVGAARPSTTTGGSAPASTCASSPTSSRAEGLELVLHPHVGTLAETAARRRARARAHRRALVLRHRPPADRRRRPGGLRPRARRRGSATSTSRTSTRGSRRTSAAARVSLVDGDAGRAVPAARRRRRADRRGRPPPRADRVRALARARAGHRDHRLGAPGRRWSCPRCAQEHRVPVHTGSEERGVPPMKRLPARVLLAVLAVAALVAAGCGGSSKDKSTAARASSAASGGGGTSVNQTQGSGLTIAMVTHSDEGSFWSVVKKGAEQAAKDEGVKLIWSPSNNDPQKEAQLIDAAVSQKVDGLAVSVPNASAIKDSLAKAKAAGIPIITLNSGAERLQGARRDHARRPDRDDRRPGGGRAAEGRRRQEGPLRHPRAEQHRPPAALRRRQAGLRRRGDQPAGQGHRGHRDDADRDQVQAPGRQVLRRRHRAEPGHRRRGEDGDQGRELEREARDVRPQPGRAQGHPVGRRRCSPSTSSSTCRATCRSCS